MFLEILRSPAILFKIVLLLKYDLNTACRIIQAKKYTSWRILDSFLIERLKKIFERSGLTQKDFAKLIGIAPSTLNDLFNDRAKTPSIETVIRVIEVFDVDPLWFLIGKDPQKKSLTPLSEDKIKEMDAHDRRFRKLNTTLGAVEMLDDYLTLDERDRATVNSLVKQLKK
ncbi:helix-turn-helix domain-containing protein [Leptospira santarosai]|uniref:helix-turn-helix domain-containing protein n=1 Tax=Leptospira santarosai TaxID=28183 RepID=UPI00036077C5|nr:helix-turn-helix transcriptional regulator [Leptospira santarosai]